MIEHLENCTVGANESGLTGETKTVSKSAAHVSIHAQLVVSPASDTIAVSVNGNKKSPLQAHNQLFRGTHVSLHATCAATNMYVDGRAARLSLNTKMYRRCDTAEQPVSQLQSKMSKIGMFLVLVLVLSECHI